MMRLIAALTLATALAACGKDGEPITPTAGLNVGVSSSGVTASANAGVKKGPWNISVGRFVF